MYILIHNNSFRILEPSEVCFHGYYRGNCPHHLTSFLSLPPEMQYHISSFIPIRKISRSIYTQKKYINSYKTRRGLTAQDIGSDKINFIIEDCTDEFIFGFLSSMYYRYESFYDSNYYLKYIGRLANLRSIVWMKEIPNSIVMECKINGHKAWISTTHPEEFMAGWKMMNDVASKINIDPRYYCDPVVSKNKISDINQIITKLRDDHLTKINSCKNGCIRDIVRCPTCRDIRLIDNDCRNCRGLLSNATYDEIKCIKCTYC